MTTVILDIANAACDAAQRGLKIWSASGPSARRAVLSRAADLIDERSAAIKKTMMVETNASEAWADFNVRLASANLREAASLTTQITGDVIPSDRPGCIAMAIRKPVGVVLGIAPWNAPIALGVRAIAAPLACGNAVVLKASEICPNTHTMIAEFIRDAGVPTDAIQIVTNEPADGAAVVDALISHPAVRKINFTGSTRVGRIIAEKAGRALKPVLLELGGKAPLIVLSDADVDAAVDGAVFGSFVNQGQVCMSTERIIVDKAVADEFTAKLAARARDLGAPAANAMLGKLINDRATEAVAALIDNAVEQGALLIAGGRSAFGLLPTILDNVQPHHRIYSDESFGPVACVIRVDSTEEAIRVANESSYGLTAAIFSRDVGRALHLAEQIEAGVCHINGSTVGSEAQFPFGGMKDSGYGRFGGKAAIAEFTDLRLITIQTERQRYPF